MIVVHFLFPTLREFGLCYLFSAFSCSQVCVSQHLDMMIWCIRHQFLRDVRSRYIDHPSWRSSFGERKSAATLRAWPDSVNQNLDIGAQSTSSLFIEDALSNLDIELGHADRDGGEIAITSLAKDEGYSTSRSRLHGMAGCYPFVSLRAAIDLLFLQGNSDMVVAKEAIVSSC